ncbi:electron transport complex protein RnfG [Clostridium tetanomorphum]|uniref:Ion-translocating oxidoreductase complex subunit G n=1 Tax=Clostridium tetanomorphum TaxID=1553 RepID=A0A923J084_CLOTT|nr:RnfABCDGE type electron transport complex subunit G [Clostridium tetanomorphum]7ZC6_G Chain G, RnfG [Clostridium tetanomorphum]KAJ52774.1 rnfG/nqrC [Clostridium tetanomorphum DSM 665]MBC2396475.1 RnfABCDGE type electron transport complex subunit G [Clostridium tetanomorphum]MBP1865357.1 electron transport complex protein RnfG [Clostridium tetanomorphum]NRS84876.1 electron transport complex protein RnfG [Clostridium tetanomorphum]NRZ98093.1 electron transport complex protein RnfG [Clostridi
MKKVSSFKLGMVLLLIAAVCGLILGGVNQVTAEPIAIQNKKTLDEANKAILPEASEFAEKTDIKGEGIVLGVTEGKSGSDLKGYTIKVAPKGYAGAIEMMVGVSTEGKVTGIKILNHAETPGLGANATDPKFSGQYANKPAKELKVVKGAASGEDEIVAITGATITSKAVTLGVNEAIKFYDTKLKGGK